MSDWNSITELMAAQKVTDSTPPHHIQQEKKRRAGNTSIDDNEEGSTEQLPVPEELPSDSPESQKLNVEQESIKLSSLIELLKAIEDDDSLDVNKTGEDVPPSQATHFEIDLPVSPPHTIVGLVVRHQNVIESDRYLIRFNKNEVSIIDKWLSHSSLIWGLADSIPPLAGNDNNDSASLENNPETYITLMLMDGIRLTLTIGPNGVLIKSDLIKGTQHIERIEKEGLNWNFLGLPVLSDGFEIDKSLPKGKTLFAGGNYGNAWFTDSNKQVWGHKTVSTPHQSNPWRNAQALNQDSEPNSILHQVERRI
jgi:hypothetical protein